MAKNGKRKSKKRKKVMSYCDKLWEKFRYREYLASLSKSIDDINFAFSFAEQIEEECYSKITDYVI
jgi:hypothetical protein